MSKLIDAINAERWENEILDDARSQDQWSADRTDHNESIDKLSRIAEKIEAENAALRAHLEPKTVEELIQTEGIKGLHPKQINNVLRKMHEEIIALRAQVPKVVKPVYRYSVDGYGYFCTCKPKNESLPELFRHYDHCPKCSAKLDWSEVAP